MRLGWIWSRAPRADKTVRSALGHLSHGLAREYKRAIATLYRLSEDPTQVEALHKALVHLTQVRTAVLRSLREQIGADPTEAASLLRELSEGVTETLRTQPRSHPHAREALVRMLNLLIVAEAQVAPFIRERPSETVRRVVVPTDLLYQTHHALFPAERMLVASGRRTGETTTLGAVFEVSGANSSGHVRADPTRLARALIAMDLSGTYLAAWLHSHPGGGPEGTHPSSIDLNQHQDWIRDYSPGLLSAVVVADGWIRFWGTALETGQIEVEVVGPGIIKEDSDDCLYRLAE